MRDLVSIGTMQTLISTGNFPDLGKAVIYPAGTALSPIYLSDGLVVYRHTGIVEYAGSSIKVRPKTFALLVLLLEHPREVLSKKYLLDTVWDDVRVDEQVLVQSIREIRHLLHNPEIIKTYPRKGYAWTAEVQTSTDAPARVQPRRAFARWRFLFLPLFVLIAAVGILYALARPTATALEGPILVLPVKNGVVGTDHMWVPLGAMEQLATLLAPGAKQPVMDPEYVLEIMRLAKVPRIYQSDQVAAIFTVSGSSLVVETSLSGGVEDYRLDYRLHFRDHVKRGTLFGDTVLATLNELGQRIAQHSGQVLADQPTLPPSNFGSELMSRALEQMDAGELETAASLLTSVKQLEPNNLVARRLLAQVKINDQEPGLAQEELTAAILAFDNTSHKELGRLQHWLAVAQAKQGLNGEALATLDSADLLAAQHQDWLYRAYSAQLRGELLQKAGQFQNAQAAINDAIRYHGVIRCPLGEAHTRLQLARLFGAQGQQDLADRSYAQAKHLVAVHQLEAAGIFSDL